MFRILTVFFLVAQVFVFSLPVFADQVVLKNGDRLTGKIIKKDDEKITIETEAAGKIAIKWEAVETIAADGELFFETADGNTIKGTVSYENETLLVTTAGADAVSLAPEKIVAIRNPEEQVAYQSEVVAKADRSLLKHWSGSADLGYSLTAGNSETSSLTFGARGVRETKGDKITLYAKGVQASNSTTGTSLTTAQALWFGGRYDRNITERFFVFGTGNLEYDKPQQLNLRIVAGGGFGYKWLRSDRTKLNVFGGATLNREYFNEADNRTSAEALVGEEFAFKFTDKTKLEQRFELYPNLSRAGTFRSNLDTSLVVGLNSWLGWHVSLGNRFNSDPVPGAKSNDLLFSTGIRATFGKKK